MEKDDLRKKLLSTLEDFESQWASLEEFRSFAEKYISLTESTYDGWYCIENDGSWDVYYQERGSIQWNVYRFKDPTRALVSAISNAQGLSLKIQEDVGFSSMQYHSNQKWQS